MLQIGKYRNRGLNWQLEGPILPRVGRQGRVFQGGHDIGHRGGQGIRHRRGGAGIPVGALVDPGANGRDLGVSQPAAVHRHRRLLESRDPPVQPALVGASRNDRRAHVTALEGTLSRAQVELGKLRGFPMAAPATPLHDRPNILGKRDG